MTLNNKLLSSYNFADEKFRMGLIRPNSRFWPSYIQFWRLCGKNTFPWLSQLLEAAPFLDSSPLPLSSKSPMLHLSDGSFIITPPNSSDLLFHFYGPLWLQWAQWISQIISLFLGQQISNLNSNYNNNSTLPYNVKYTHSGN